MHIFALKDILTTFMHINVFKKCVQVNFTSSSLLEEAMVSAYDLTRYSLRLTFFVASNLYGMFGYCTWMILLLPIRLVLPDIFWRLESVIFKGLQSNVIVWMCSGGYGGKS